ncbi:hypothetical protein [Sphingomonas sp. DT-204]|uniref:hypothetical protein n=1 Tax=Sphingomonas sp. DT-204 TaxID=3396166 RepID=UPI003F1A99F0
MRLVLTAAAFVVAAPAAAQDHAASAAKIGEALANPVVQDGVAQAVTNIADALLATRVGPLARYTDPDDDIHPGDTLADIERRRDPDYRRHLQERTRRSVAAAGQAASDAGAIAVELKATGDRLQAALAPLVAALGLFSSAPDEDHD